MVIGMHLCRGNYRGRWLASGGYYRVAERIFNIPGIAVFFMEYNSPHTGFRRCNSCPRTSGSSWVWSAAKLPAIEDKWELLKRIDEAAQFTALDRLGISPQCGFATNLTGSPLTQADERAKLQLVVDIASEVWKH